MSPNIVTERESVGPELSALELERHISVPEAAALKGISSDTFRRHFSHLIRKVSPRRRTVKVRDLLASDTAAADRAERRAEVSGQHQGGR
jgi:hypothetical protein